MAYRAVATNQKVDKTLNIWLSMLRDEIRIEQTQLNKMGSIRLQLDFELEYDQKFGLDKESELI